MFTPPEISRSKLDGLPVFSIDGPRPFTAHLVFRVGIYDEPLRHRGITHLIEHLALQPVKDAEVTFNGSVAPHLTMFTAQGHPDAVGWFLRLVCQSIHDLPFDRLEVEADVLRQEHALRQFSYFNTILWAYFGARGPGVASYGEFGMQWLQPEEIREWASRYFTRQNAALLIVGNVPDSFGLDLPEGERMSYQAPDRLIPPPESATLLDTQATGVTWGTLMRHEKRSPEPAFYMGLETLARRLQDRLRHDLGRTYSVSFDWHRIDANLMAGVLGFDCEPTLARECGLEHTRVLREFMEEGPTRGELDRALRAQIRAYEDHPLEAARHHLYDEAEAYLSGWGSTAPVIEYRRQAERLTPDDVSERFREAYRQSYTIADLPPGELAEAPLTVMPSPTPLPGVLFMTKRRHRKEQAALVRIGPEGISAKYSEGWMNLTLDDLELVVEDEKGIRIFGLTSTEGFEAERYNNTLVPTSSMRLALAIVVVLASAAIVANWPEAWIIPLLMVVGYVLYVAIPVESEGTLIRDRSVSMQEAVRRYLPEEVVLGERVSSESESGPTAPA